MFLEAVCTVLILLRLFFSKISFNSAVGIAAGYRLDERECQSSSPGRVKNFLYSVQTGSGAHPASHPMGIGRFFLFGGGGM
jgi:hypothetical protein